MVDFVTLRFVTTDNLASALIRRVSRGPVSHVEFIAPDGQTVIGAFDDLGVAERPIGYETVTKDIRVSIGTGKADAVYASARALVGEPYDWKGVFGFLADEDCHEYGHLFCSAFAKTVLQANGVMRPSLFSPGETSPSDLLRELEQLGGVTVAL